MTSNFVQAVHHPLRPQFGRWLLVAVILAAVACVGGWGLSRTALDTWFFVENGPVELLECAFLALAIVPISAASMRAESWSALACSGLVIVIALMIVREMPRCDGPFAEQDLCLGADTKNMSYAVIPLLVFGLYCALKRPFAALRSRFHPLVILREVLWIWPVVGTIVLLFMAQGAEAFHWQEIEELLELAGYLYLALLGFWMLRHADSLSAADSASSREPAIGHPPVSRR